MPLRSLRSVSRGVQDEEEIKAIKHLEKQKKKNKTLKWCGMIGMTLLEFILCLICISLGYVYYHMVIMYRNEIGLKHKTDSFRYILLPPAPPAIAGVYLTLTYVDLISWHNVRPIPYFGWIMVTTSGFLMFLLYAGIIILSCSTIIAYIAIVFGILTALVFLTDLICMLLSMKRFPAPYYVIKRKYDKMDQCVCTGDYDPEEADMQRPICRCGENWGEPCVCDHHNPLNPSCACGARKGKLPCDCCECAGRVPDDEEEDGSDYTLAEIKSMVSTMTGRDYIEERRKTMLTQAGDPHKYCTNRPVYCIDGPRETTKPDFYRSIAAQSQGQSHHTTTIYSTQPSIPPSTIHRTPSAVARSALTSPSKMSQRSIPKPTITQAAQIGGFNEELTEIVGVPNAAVARKIATHHPKKHQRKTQHAYSLHSTTVEDPKSVEQTIASKYDRKKKGATKSLFRRFKFGDKTGGAHKGSTSEDEIGEGDYPRDRSAFPTEPFEAEAGHGAYKRDATPRTHFSTYTIEDRTDPEFGYLSDSEVTTGPARDYTLPGQTSSVEDSRTYSLKKNVSVSARERSSRSTLRTPSTICSEDEHVAPPSSISTVVSPRLIRNVSTTVRAVRTLSRVMEADNESRSVSQSDRDDIRDSDRFPSESTITIKK